MRHHHQATETTRGGNLIRAARLTGNGPRVMVEQPDSRGISGFFVAILSVVTQFDVCPVGWYNCRMEFFGKDSPLYYKPVKACF